MLVIFYHFIEFCRKPQILLICSSEFFKTMSYYFFNVEKCHNCNQKSKTLKYSYFYDFKKEKCVTIFPNIFRCFSLFQSPRPLRIFCCTLTSLNSISEPNNQVCVLGAINERYEAKKKCGAAVVTKIVKTPKKWQEKL